MLLVLPGLILLSAPLLMLAVRLIRPSYAYLWLVAIAAAFGSLAATLLLRLQIPHTFQLSDWPTSTIAIPHSFLLDTVSWPFCLAMALLCFVIILTAPARTSFPASIDVWTSWAWILALAGLGILAVLAGSPLTLVLAWAAIDLVELVILLDEFHTNRKRRQVVAAFAVRLGGILLLIWAWLTSQSPEGMLNFSTISPESSMYLLLAASLRLGVLPLHMPLLGEDPQRRGLGTALRLAPAAASLVLLVRSAQSGIPAPIYPFVLGLTGLAAMYSAAVWVTAQNELHARPFWLLSMASLAVAASLNGQPTASQAWGLALLFSGGLIFLFSVRTRRHLPLLALGLINFSGLPFTPGWEGMRIYSSPVHLLTLIFPIVHALLVIGYARHALRTGDSFPPAERWVAVIYPIGLGLLPLGHWLAALRISQEVKPMPLQSWLGGPLLLAIIAAVLYVGYSRRLPSLPRSFRDIWQTVFSFEWVYAAAWSVFDITGRSVAWLTHIIEGEGGVLWAFVLLALVLSLVISQGGGWLW